MTEIGVGMLGYEFMGKAHSSAFRNVRHVSPGPAAPPGLVAIAGRDEAAVAPPPRYGYERWTTDWRDLVADPTIDLFDNGGRNAAHAEPTIAAAEAGEHVALREAARPRRRRGVRDLVARGGDRGQAPLRLQLPLRARGQARPRAHRGGELGEIRHFSARYLQDWALGSGARNLAAQPRAGPAPSATWRLTSSTSPAFSSASCRRVSAL